LFKIKKRYLPTPSATPNKTREKINMLTEDEIIGVKRVINDQSKTDKVSIFFPPNLFEKLPPIILNF
jgi:hypothetical protein